MRESADQLWGKRAAAVLTAGGWVSSSETNTCAGALSTLFPHRTAVVDLLVREWGVSSAAASELLAGDGDAPTLTPSAETSAHVRRTLANFLRPAATLPPHPASDAATLARETPVPSHAPAPTTATASVGHGRYEVQRRVAHGGMGAIFLCADRELRREVAMKVMLGEVRDGPAAARFLKEAQAAAQLQHPAILPLFDFGRIDVEAPALGLRLGDPFFMMRWIPESTDLGEVLSALAALRRNPRLRRVGTTSTGRAWTERGPEDATHPSAPDSPADLEVLSRELTAAGVRFLPGEEERTLDRIRRIAHTYSLFRLLETFERICHGIAYAHSRGVVHRDLKPDNILLSAHEEVFVTDFGLVKAVERIESDARADGPTPPPDVEEKLSLLGGSATLSGAIMGTPCYMPPEQARGDVDQIGPHSDVYSLGAILYEVLTLRRPYDEHPHALAVLHAVREGEPAALNQVRPDVDPELAAICRKAMDRDPSQRYAGAAELATDVRRWREGLPVRAFPLGRIGRFRKFVRRNRGVSVAVTSAFLIVLILSIVFISLLKNETDRALDEAVRATAAERHAQNEAEKARRMESLAGDRADELARQKQLLDEQLDDAYWEAYQKSSFQEPPDAIGQLLVAVTARDHAIEAGIESPYEWDPKVRRRLHEVPRLVGSTAADTPFLDLAVSPDGRSFAGAALNGVVRLFETATGSPLGTRTQRKNPVRAVAYDARGEILAAGGMDGEILLADVETGEDRGRCTGHGSFVSDLAFRPGGRLLASAGLDTTVRLWDIASRKEVQKWTGDSLGAAALAFEPSGRRLAGLWGSGEVSVWDMETKEKVAATSASVDLGNPLSIAFSPDGSTIAAAGSTGRILILDAHAPDLPTTFVLDGHSKDVRSLAFHPGGRLLASGSLDHTVRIWDLAGRRSVIDLRAHAPARGQDSRLFQVAGLTGGVTGVAFNAAGDVLFTSGADGTIKVWDVRTERDLAVFRTENDAASDVAVSPSGETVASAGRSLVLWDPPTGRPRANLTPSPDWFYAVTFSPDGARIVALTEKEVFVWDASTTTELARWNGGSSGMRSLAIHPERAILATGHMDGSIRYWSATTGEPQERFARHLGGVSRLCFSPEGALLVSSGWDWCLRVMNADDGKTRHLMKSTRMGVNAVAFHPTEPLVAGTWEDVVEIWDTRTGKRRASLAGHEAAVKDVAFHPKGTLLASAGEDRTIRLWDLSARRVQATLQGHEKVVQCLAFSPDGSFLVSGAGDGAVRLWNMDPHTLSRAEVERTTGSRLTGFEVGALPRAAYAAPKDGANSFLEFAWPERNAHHWLRRSEAGDAEALHRLGILRERERADVAAALLHRAAAGGKGEWAAASRRRLERMPWLRSAGETAYASAQAAEETGDWVAAWRHYDEACRLAPDNGAYLAGYSTTANNIAWILATGEEPDPLRAVEIGELAVTAQRRLARLEEAASEDPEGTPPPLPGWAAGQGFTHRHLLSMCLDTLAAAYFARKGPGDLVRARSTQAEAVRTGPPPAVLVEMEERKRRYEEADEPGGD